MYTGYITRIKNLHKHPNADRLLCGECFGNTVIVGIDTTPDELGVYFPVDGALGIEFAQKNDLLRRKDENGDQVGGYLDPDKRNIKALRLRGEKSDGLFLPISCLEDFCDVKMLIEGDRISILNGVTICEKYIPKSKERTSPKVSGKKSEKRYLVSPLFLEHVDTAQLAYNLSEFHDGDLVEITLKMHGTSQRTAYLPILKGFKRTLFDRIFKRNGTPIYEYGYVSGTRRTILDTYDGGYYGNNSFREPHAKKFEGKLWKGEEVYYEVVGFTDSGLPIMPPGNNEKIGDKQFVKEYGKTTVFSYGCDPRYKSGLYNNPDSDRPSSDIYVYRMTMTNEDGDVVEYTPDFMRYRCDQMGVKYVPVLHREILHEPDDWTGDWSPGDYVKALAEEYYDGPDPIGKTHIREGVVCRIVNRPVFSAYKHKNWNFKVLEGIVKDSASSPDMEEAEELKEGAG